MQFIFTDAISPWLLNIELAFHMCSTKELDRLSHTVRLANVHTAQGSSACVNNMLYGLDPDYVYISPGNDTCKFVSYGSSLLF